MCVCGLRVAVVSIVRVGFCWMVEAAFGSMNSQGCLTACADIISHCRDIDLEQGTGLHLSGTLK